MAQHQKSDSKLPITSPPVKAASDRSNVGRTPAPPPSSPPGGPSSGHCAHDGTFECSNCGVMFANAELCRDPDAHACSASNPKGLGGERQIPERGTNGAATYARDWPKNPQGHALPTFTNPHTKRSVTVPCFKDYMDRETGVVLPLCAVDQRIIGDVAEIISGRSPSAWKEEAAHVPGRDTNSHARMYFSVPFFRDYVFVALHRDSPRQTRSDRRWKIRRAHRDANCSDPCCRRRH